MKEPLVSVIIVVFNAGDTLGYSIESVMQQTYTNWELVIIDGGSTDNTPLILEEHKSRIAYSISEKDKGIYDAMNKGILAAKGEWLYFLGADDIFINQDVLYHIFSQPGINAAEFLYGNVELKQGGQILGGSRSYQQLIGKNISHQAIFYKRTLFDKVGNYNTRYKILADYDLNLRIFEQEKILKKYYPVTVCLFNNKGVSNITIDSNFFLDKLQYFLQVKKLPPGDPSLQHYYFYAGFVMLFRYKKPQGLRYCARAFITGPRKLFYLLVFLKFIVSYLGIGRKVKIV
jgi:glycosyltransferase involved in cell wall biosynthesis